MAPTKKTNVVVKQRELIRFVKFRIQPKPVWSFQSGDSLWVSRDKIRTHIFDPVDVSSGAREKRKVAVEFGLNEVEDAEVVNTTSRDAKTLIINTSKVIHSCEGHVLSSTLLFYFRPQTEKAHIGSNTGRSGQDHLNKLCTWLEECDIDVLRGSSNATTSQKSSSDGLDGNPNDGMSVDGAGTRARKHVTIAPPNQPHRREREQSDEQSEREGSLLQDELYVPSSQPSKRSLAYDDDEDDAGHDTVEDGNEDTKVTNGRHSDHTRISPPRKKQQHESTLTRPETHELVACLDALKKHVVENWLSAGERAKWEQSRLESQLWRNFRAGIEQTSAKSMSVASTLNKSVSGVQVHGQRFRALLDEAKGSCDKVEKLLEQARLTVCSQREQLGRLSPPFD